MLLSSKGCLLPVSRPKSAGLARTRRFQSFLKHIFRSVSVSGAVTCMTRALLKARISPGHIQRVAKSLVREHLDEQLLSSLDFSTTSTALRAAGISSWATRHKIFQCFNSGEQARRHFVISECVGEKV